MTREQVLKRIVGNEYGSWWNRFARATHPNRLKDDGYVKEQAFRAGVEAGIKHANSSPETGA